MSSATKPVEQKARELLDKFESAVRVNEDFHIAGTPEGRIEVVLSVISVNERRDALLAALNTDGERIRREALDAFIRDREAYAASIRSRSNQHANGIIETLALLRSLSTPSKGVG